MISPDDLRNYSVFTTEQELDFYIGAAYARFCKTVTMADRIPHASVFEFGANPYLMTVMLKDEVRSIVNYDMANWFGETYEDVGDKEAFRKVQVCTQHAGPETCQFLHFNVEDAGHPVWETIGTERYDVVLFCEILEHLLVDPKPLMNRVQAMLKPGGHLILTTPNVFSRRNKDLWRQGNNIHEWYSPNGPYGRHNRVWSVPEVLHFVKYWGFQIEDVFTHDACLAAATTPRGDMADGDTIFTLLRRP